MNGMLWGCRRVAYPYHYGWCSHGLGFNQKRMQRELGSGSRALNKSSTGEDWREERPYTHRRRRYSRATHLADAAEALRLSGIGVARRRCISGRSDEHTSELQSLMRISCRVFCFKKKTH